MKKLLKKFKKTEKALHKNSDVLNSHDARITNLENRQDNLETELDEVKKEQNRVRETLQNLNVSSNKNDIKEFMERERRCEEHKRDVGSNKLKVELSCPDEVLKIITQPSTVTDDNNHPVIDAEKARVFLVTKLQFQVKGIYQSGSYVKIHRPTGKSIVVLNFKDPRQVFEAISRRNKLKSHNESSRNCALTRVLSSAGNRAYALLNDIKKEGKLSSLNITKRGYITVARTDDDWLVIHDLNEAVYIYNKGRSSDSTN